MYTLFLLPFIFSPFQATAQDCFQQSGDISYQVTGGVTTLEVHSFNCGDFVAGDEIILTCIDGNNAQTSITFQFQNCSPVPPKNGSLLVTNSFTATADISGCLVWEVLYPNHVVGYYPNHADEVPDMGTDASGDLVLYFCEDECLEFSVVDAWGAQIGNPNSVPCCVNGVTQPAPDCTVCEIYFGGTCGPCDDSYGQVDFGCIEINRSDTRLMYITSCAFGGNIPNPNLGKGVQDDFNINSLFTGDITCNYPLDFILDKQGNLKLPMEDCEIIIHDIMVHPNIGNPKANGESAFELVGDFTFPFTLTRGDNLPFEIKFAPHYYGPQEAIVTICYENTCECDGGPGPEKNDPEGHEMHCMTTSWYDFTVVGYGNDCQEFEGSLECTNKCPECITLASALEGQNGGGISSCGGYLDYITGYASPDGQPSGVFNCGEYSLSTNTGQLYFYDNGVCKNCATGWIETFPGFLTKSGCGYYTLPTAPLLFRDGEDNELYLIPGNGLPVEEIDVILGLDYFNSNCGDFQPGEQFILYSDNVPLKNALPPDAAVSFYEYIACDGQNVFARLVSGELPEESCYIAAEYPNLGSMGFYFDYYDKNSKAPPSCNTWGLDYCEALRTDLYVTHSSQDYDYLVCNDEFFDVNKNNNQLNGCETSYVSMGCTTLGSTLKDTFGLLHCSTYDIDFKDGGQSKAPGIDCSYIIGDIETGLGQGCEIIIDSIRIGIPNFDWGPYELDPSPDFSILMPATPDTLSFTELDDLIIAFTPTTSGFQNATVVIYYQNSCAACDFDIRKTEGEGPGHFNEVFVFEVEACAVETSNTDENLDGELEVLDPCACDDPQNTYDASNELALFHDFISVGGMNIDDTYDIEVEITGGELYDMSGVVLPRLGENNRIQLNWDAGRNVHFLEFWTAPGVGFQGTIYVNGSQVNEFLDSVCTGPCAPIPTIGQWGIIVLSLLLIIFGLSYQRRRKLQLS